jgi:N,N'-diacetylbacillosaminyl-diphospho-undecaprenol alpha-1,3-N-acetylgalactosaminyltransferase
VPRSLIEALALDKYIITTDTPGCRETIIDSWNGDFCKAGDVHDLVSKLVHIDGDFLQNRKGRSRDLCERKFDVEKQIDLISNHYFMTATPHG